MARYTVIGASGFVGQRLSSALRQAGHEVYAPARGDAELFSRDLGRVFYCAGLTADYAIRPYDTVEAHVSLLARVLREADFTHLIYLSSVRLYDSVGETAGKQALVLNPAEPSHLYHLSKALGENLCLTVEGGRAAVARMACVYDWSQGSPGFLSEWLQRATREKSFTLDSGTGVVRDYIHLDDTVATLRAMSDGSVTGVVNVASGENVSNAELGETFNRNGWSVSFAWETPRQNMPVCDTQRMVSLGVQARPVHSVVETYLRGIQ